MQTYTIQDYVNKLNNVSLDYSAAKHSELIQVFRVEEGRKYAKVVQEYANCDFGSGLSVHSFVDKETGDIYKPASWKAPAKGVRYNLRDLENIPVDIFGSYLYAR